MEDIQTKVPIGERTVQLAGLVNEPHAVALIRDMLAEQVRLAYIAGACGLDLSQQPIKGVPDTGEVAVRASIYAKDKGFKL